MKTSRLVVAVLLLLNLRATANDRDTLVKNVRISFDATVSIFPDSWQPAPISAKAIAISTAEQNRSLNITGIALKKYPEVVLKTNLKAIFWLSGMSFYDVGYGGTNATDALYLTNDGVANGYTDLYLEQTFHHEFSSILLRNYPSLLDTSAWKKANAGKFDYNDPENGVGAIRSNAASQDLDTLLCKRGMLTQYAMSSMENDVNTFAQNMFCPSADFWKAVDRFPRIRTKFLLMVGLYHGIDPMFTEAYFRKMK